MTRTGWAGAVVGTVLLVLGLSNDTPEFTIVATVTLSVVLFAVVTTRGAVPVRLETTLAPDHVPVGTPASLLTEVTNESDKALPALLFRQSEADGASEHAVVALQPNGRREELLPLRTDRRGVFSVGALEVSRVDPLALARSAPARTEPKTLVVHPRVHPLPAGVSTSRRGEYGVRSDQWAAGSETFHALREYSAGDDHRHIHWASSARTGELVVKQFVDLWQAELLVIVDTRPEPYDGERFELAAEVAASLAVAGVSERQSTTVLLGDGSGATSAPGRGHARPLLDALAATDPTGGLPLPALAHRLRRHDSARFVIAVTGDIDTSEGRQFFSAGRSFRRRMVIRVAPGLGTGRRVELSERGDETISISDADEFVAAWAELNR
jgi:uncharacterized protein (DUF58 family)